MAEPPADATTLRRRIFEILEPGSFNDRISWYVDRCVILLVFASLTATLFESAPEHAARYRLWFLLIEAACIVVFTAEYLLRIWSAAEQSALGTRGPAQARLQYARSPMGIIDLLSVLPFWLSLAFPIDAGILLALRAIRFLKFVRYSSSLRTLLEVVYAERRPLFGGFLILIGSAIFSSVLIHLAERHAQPEKFGQLLQTFWWGMLTLAGYGDAVPVTPLGRIVMSLVIFAGFLIIALPVGILATAFANEVKRRDFIVTWTMVARVPLFMKLDAHEIADVAKLLRSHAYEAGSTIVRRGDHGDSMYFITAGQVEVATASGLVRLGVGDFFGETALLKKVQRNATVTAVTRVQVLMLGADDLEALMDRAPGIAEVIQHVTSDRGG